MTPLADSHAAARPLPRVWLITALFLIGMNLRPALSSVAPLLDDIRTAIGIRIFFGSHGMFAGTLIAGLSIGVIMILLPGVVKRDFPKQAPRCRSSS